jgi:L-ascorbate metabolism protein UlaG (beta-lactamase superfamily)
MSTVKCFGRWTMMALSLVVPVIVAFMMMAAPSRAANDVKVEWMTWGFYRITSPGGKVIMINPWYENFDGGFTLDDIPDGDIILITSGHFDEIGNALQIGAKTGATIVASHEVVAQTLRQQDGAGFFDPISFDGAEIPVRMVQPSSRITIDGITIRVVNSAHGDWNTGGSALGYFVTMENGFTVYYSGGTDLTLDMKLWGELFQPDAALLYYAADPDPSTVAMMAQFLSESNPNLKTVMPQHQPLNPMAGMATPADLGRAMVDLGLRAKFVDPEPGTVYSLTK